MMIGNVLMQFKTFEKHTNVYCAPDVAFTFTPRNVGNSGSRGKEQLLTIMSCVMSSVVPLYCLMNADT